MLVRYIIVVVLSCIVIGCGTTQPITSTDSVRIVHDVQYRDRWHYDSIYTDRWHVIEHYGDTVYRHDSTVHHHHHYYYFTDTVALIDTTKHNTSNTVEVERELTTWQKWLQALGYGSIGTLASILIAGIVFLFVKIK